MVRVIATDLDGTLLKNNKRFCFVEKNYKKYIKNFYGDIVITSGRNPKFCAKICNELKIHHNFIALNGAVIVKNGNIIYKQSMKKTILSLLLEFLNSYYTDFEFLVFDKYDRILCYSPINKLKIKLKHLIIRIKRGKLANKIITSNKQVLRSLKNSNEIYKVIIYSKNCDDMYNLLKNEFSEHFELFATDNSIEISPIGVSKGAALKHLISTTKVKNKEVFVVGDSSNDISMFEMFENSFVMESAKNNIKVKAKYTISKFSDLEKYTKLNNNFKED